MGGNISTCSGCILPIESAAVVFVRQIRRIFRDYVMNERSKYMPLKARLFHLITAFLPCPPPQNLPFAHSDAEAALRCFFFKKESGRLLPEKCSRLTIVIQLFIPARIPGLMSPHTWADEPACPGR